MKTKDRIKEEIGLNKLLITMFSAVDFSLISWVWNNNSFSNIEKIFYYFLIFALIIFPIILYVKTDSKIRELDKYI